MITNVEHDHFSFFKTFDEYKETFKKRVMTLREGGAVIADLRDQDIREILKDFKGSIVDYSKYIEVVPEDTILFGEHNRENMAAIYAVAHHLGEDEENIRTILKNFRGSFSRMEPKPPINGKKVFEDFAHHPTAIKRACESLKKRYPNKRIATVLEIHQFSRINNLYDKYIKAFVGTQVLFLLPIFPARENINAEFDYKKFMANLEKHSKCEVHLSEKKDLQSKVQTHINEFDIIVTLSATPIVEYLYQKRGGH